MATQLIGLISSDFEHPLDRKVLEMLKGKSLFHDAVNGMLNWGFVKWELIALKGGYFQITPESCKDLHDQIVDVQKTLDVLRLPELYTKWDYAVNGYTTGTKDDTLMVLHSGAVDLLSEQELRFVVGHEFGHIKSDHVLLHMMADMINSGVSLIPVVGNFVGASNLLLMYWKRMSEFSADRAGLLACQDIDVALDCIIKMAGIPKKLFGTNARDGFMEQAKKFSLDLSDFSDKAIKTVTIATSTHPWTVMRAAELIKWYESGEYQKIMDKYEGKMCPVHKGLVAKDTLVCPICEYRFE